MAFSVRSIIFVPILRWRNELAICSSETNPKAEPLQTCVPEVMFHQSFISAENHISVLPFSCVPSGGNAPSRRTIAESKRISPHCVAVPPSFPFPPFVRTLRAAAIMLLPLEHLRSQRIRLSLCHPRSLHNTFLLLSFFTAIDRSATPLRELCGHWPPRSLQALLEKSQFHACFTTELKTWGLKLNKTFNGVYDFIQSY